MMALENLDKTIEFLSDPAHWARNAGIGGKTACIISAAWYTNGEAVPYIPAVRQAIMEWYSSKGMDLPPVVNTVITDFNDVHCPDHATLMQVLRRAREIIVANAS